jgi:hypothetical protein
MTKRPTKDAVPEDIEKFIAEPSDILNCYFGFVEGLGSFNNPECRPWLEMCVAVDETGDFAPLLERLPFGAPLEVMPFVRDLFERHGKIKGVRGNLNRTPLYADTPTEARLAMAIEDVRELHRDGMTIEKAIEVAAEWHATDGVTQSALSNAYKGQSDYFKRWQERAGRRIGRHT